MQPLINENNTFEVQNIKTQAMPGGEECKNIIYTNILINGNFIIMVLSFRLLDSQKRAIFDQILFVNNEYLSKNFALEALNSFGTRLKNQRSIPLSSLQQHELPLCSWKCEIDHLVFQAN